MSNNETKKELKSENKNMTIQLLYYETTTMTSAVFVMIMMSMTMTLLTIVAHRLNTCIDNKSN